ncbi:GPO family capsid scaffolding protein [Erythrobacter sp. EC-HK427]|uniref:GPO family capsid scaffolding protein n=1 Tax=Erythrobacter sp. EC-HK427 TaxID=2038396 RepID=UPI001258C116|nr:GPO family capsid scaffolding protein [Erythrobacter sp. EC-HK427]VVT07489.1 Phage capsid scaffolding protein [Erythrobacter sp. EC-HK427]
MKTKKFRLAVAGATVDGREISADMLREMAEGYDPNTYGARLNIEHIRGVVPGSDFGAYGDVLELSTEEVEIKLHDKVEKRVALFGTFDVDDKAKAMNKAGQKLYPSVEIQPNFAGTGKAYLMGVALTDSPASIATERMQFNRQMPGSLVLRTDDAESAFALTFAEDDGTPTDAGTSFLTKLGGMLDGFAAKFGGDADAGKGDDKPKAGQAGDAAAAFATLRPMFEDMGKAFSTEIGKLQAQIADQNDSFSLRVKKLEDQLKTDPAPGYSARPAAAGAQGELVETDC